MQRVAVMALVAVLTGCALGMKSDEIRAVQPREFQSKKNVDAVFQCLNRDLAAISHVMEITTLPASGVIEMDVWLGQRSQKFSYYLISISPVPNGSQVERRSAGVSFPRMPEAKLDDVIAACV